MLSRAGPQLGPTVFAQDGGDGVSYLMHFSSNLTLTLLPTRRLLWLILWNMFKKKRNKTGGWLLYSAVPASAMQQSERHICTRIPSLLDFLPLGQHRAQSRVQLPGLYSRFLLVTCVMHNIHSVHVSIPMSQFIPPSLRLNDPAVHSIHLGVSFCFVN